MNRESIVEVKVENQVNKQNECIVDLISLGVSSCTSLIITNVKVRMKVMNMLKPFGKVAELTNQHLDRPELQA